MGDLQISIPPSSMKINLPRVIFLFGKFKRDWSNLSHPDLNLCNLIWQRQLPGCFQMMMLSICFLLFLKISNSCLGFFISVFLNVYFCAFVVLLAFYLVTNSFTKQVTKIFIYSGNLCFAHTGTTDFFFSLEVW